MPTIINAATLTRRERLAAALRAKDGDHFMERGRIVVCGRTKDGNLVEFGNFDPTLAFQNGQPGPHSLIDQILFSQS